MVEREHLRDHSAHTEAEDVDLFDFQGVNEAGCYVGPACKGWWHIACGFANAVVVEEEDWAGFGEEIDQEGVPVVHCAAKVLVKYQWSAGGGSKEAVGYLDAIHVDVLRFGGLLGRHREGLV